MSNERDAGKMTFQDHFQRVLATDASPEQLSRAQAHKRVNYALAHAEKLPVPDHTVDLVAVAAAVHWFKLDRFYDEVHRVLRPGGVIAIWSYYNAESEPAIQAILDRYADEIVAPYWPEANQLNRAQYASISFPFDELEVPRFHAETWWTRDELLGFTNTWSATQAYMDAHGAHPRERIFDDLNTAWGDPNRRVHMRWPLHIRVGRIP